MPQTSTVPQQFRCIECDQIISRKDILWSHKAEQFDGGTCICEDCYPKWIEKINPPHLDHVKDQEKHESFIAHYLHHAHEKREQRKARKELEKAQDDYASVIHAALEDPSLRSILLAVSSLSNFQRNSILNTVIAQLELQGAPEELLVAMHSLKDDDMAAKTKLLLTGEED